MWQIDVHGALVLSRQSHGHVIIKDQANSLERLESLVLHMCFAMIRTTMPWYARTVMLFVFALYWGGLTFYTGIVVRIIHFVLNDPMDGGLITQRVTNYLQLLGFCVLPFMIWNGMAVVRQSKRLGVILLVLTGILVLH